MTVSAPPPRDELELLIREARQRQRRRQALAAAVVLVATAAAFAGYAVARGGSPAGARGGAEPVAASRLPRCRSGQLGLSVPPTWGAAAGSLYEPATLTNTSGTSCTVAGWPAVRRLDRAGRAIPVDVQRWVYVERGPAPFRTVRLAPGGAATFQIFGQDWNHAVDRACRQAQRLQVEPRGGGGWLFVPVDLPACRRWDVGPLVPGRIANPPTLALRLFYRPPTRRHRFYAGRMDGTSWQLRVRDGGDGRYCIRVLTDGVLWGRKCGRLYGPGVDGKLGFVYREGAGGPGFVAGAVSSKAQVVAIRLSRGHPLYVQTMPPNRYLSPGISFFFTTTPRGARPVRIGASTRAGRTVLTWRPAP